MARIIFIVCALLLIVSGAEAVTLHLDPATLVASPGDTVSLDLVASGLGGAAIGDFDVDIAFASGALTFTGVTLGDGLGDIDLGDGLDFSLGLVSAGLVNLAVVSTLSGADLLALQSDPLTLATLTFDVVALAPGTSTIVTVATVHALGDADGAALQISALGDATIRAPGGVAIPEPGSLWLLASGLLGAAVIRRCRRRED